VKNRRADIPHTFPSGSTNYCRQRRSPVEQRAPILAVYRPLAGKVVEGYWRELPDDADHPVFALTRK